MARLLSADRAPAPTLLERDEAVLWPGAPGAPLSWWLRRRPAGRGNLAALRGRAAAHDPRRAARPGARSSCRPAPGPRPSCARSPAPRATSVRCCRRPAAGWPRYWPGSATGSPGCPASRPPPVHGDFKADHLLVGAGHRLTAHRPRPVRLVGPGARPGQVPGRPALVDAGLRAGRGRPAAGRLPGRLRPLLRPSGWPAAGARAAAAGQDGRAAAPSARPALGPAAPPHCVEPRRAGTSRRPARVAHRDCPPPRASTPRRPRSAAAQRLAAAHRPAYVRRCSRPGAPAGAPRAHGRARRRPDAHRLRARSPCRISYRLRLGRPGGRAVGQLRAGARPAGRPRRALVRRRPAAPGAARRGRPGRDAGPAGALGRVRRAAGGWTRCGTAPAPGACCATGRRTGARTVREAATGSDARAARPGPGRAAGGAGRRAAAPGHRGRRCPPCSATTADLGLVLHAGGRRPRARHARVRPVRGRARPAGVLQAAGARTWPGCTSAPGPRARCAASAADLAELRGYLPAVRQADPALAGATPGCSTAPTGCPPRRPTSPPVTARCAPTRSWSDRAVDRERSCCSTWTG